MDWIKAALLTGLLGTLMPHYAAEVTAADRGRGGRGCQRGERINIQDLDMSPDPIVEGQRVRAWKVRINYNGGRDCDTDVFVRDGNAIVGHMRDYKMRPGVNEIEIPAADTFRFRGRELCLNVQVDLEGSRQQIDADRKFCAHPRTVWTMREPEDRRPGNR